MRPWVERTPDAKPIPDIFNIFYQECYGILHLPSGKKLIIDSPVDLEYFEKVVGGPCPNDTDGDGNCGRVGCLTCGDYK